MAKCYFIFRIENSATCDQTLVEEAKNTLQEPGPLDSRLEQQEQQLTGKQIKKLESTVIVPSIGGTSTYQQLSNQSVAKSCKNTDTFPELISFVSNNF